MLRVGFACAWEPQPELTWSQTPWQLRKAMRSECSVVDLDLTYPRLARLALKAAYTRRTGRGQALWKHSAPARRLNETRLHRLDHPSELDAILQIGDLGRTSTPYYLLQDLSYDMLLDLSAAEHAVKLQFSTLSLDRLERLRDRQRRLYEGAAGVIAMSQWLGAHLVSVSGVPAERVHVVNPGATAAASSVPLDLAEVTQRRLQAPRTRLLFVGRDFIRKGGDQVLAAVKELRQDAGSEITLTVAGPKSWPVPGAIPDGVNFVGPVAAEQVTRLYDQHDLFVLPSHFEAFGIVFAEALSRGLPCIGRRAFAMPEIIEAGRTGMLVESTDPHELACLVAEALADDALISSAHDYAGVASEHYTWSRAAREVVAAMTGH